MMQEIEYLQSFEEAISVLAGMKSYLESSLDSRSGETLSEWGKHWKNYRDGKMKLPEVIPHLPKYAQVQYNQIVQLKSFFDAIRITINDLQVEREEAYLRGFKRGRSFEMKEGLSFRELRYFDPERAREISILESITKYNL